MNDLTNIKNRIEQMNELQQKEVFKIFLNNNIDYNENSNGIFINLTNINKNIIKELKKYIDYVNKQNTFLSEQEEQKQQYIQNYFNNEINEKNGSEQETLNEPTALL